MKKNYIQKCLQLIFNKRLLITVENYTYTHTKHNTHTHTTDIIQPIISLRTQGTAKDSPNKEKPVTFCISYKIFIFLYFSLLQKKTKTKTFLT